MIPCQEPNCQDYAHFNVSHGPHTYHFCTVHVWNRTHRWLNKLNPGEQVCVTSRSGKAETSPIERGTLRDMRSDNTAGELVVSAAHDLESTEGSATGRSQTATPGEVPAMRKPARKARRRLPLRVVSK